MGFPSPAQDYIEKSLSLDELCIRHPAATFFMRAGDDCMRAGIFKDAVLVIDRDITPTHGSVVIAVVDGHHAIRRLLLRPQPALERLDGYGQPIVIDIDADEGLVIFGVVTHVVNEMRKGVIDENPGI